MPDKERSGRLAGAVPPRVRTEPVQERSAARVDRLLDAAAEVVDEVGIERITTAMVAERAGASIGTVYRYFPDRIALLQALRDRTVARFRVRVIDELHRDRPRAWWDGVDSAVAALAELHRSEPGVRVIRFDESERGLPQTEEASPGHFARWFAQILEEEFGQEVDDALLFDLEVAVEIGDALMRRAFLLDPAGDERFLDAARSVVREYLARRHER